MRGSQLRILWLGLCRGRGAEELVRNGECRGADERMLERGGRGEKGLNMTRVGGKRECSSAEDGTAALGRQSWWSVDAGSKIRHLENPLGIILREGN